MIFPSIITPRRALTRFAIILIGFAAMQLNLFAGTLIRQPHYVKADATGSNDGLSWENAYTDLQDAITAATPGDSIWVAYGTYTPTDTTNRSISFTVSKDLNFYGGFAGTEPSVDERNSDLTSNATFLSGNIGDPMDREDNSHQVMLVSDNVNITLDRISIEDGNGSISGAGIVLKNSVTAVFRNLNFKNNSSAFNGGAIYVEKAALTLDNITFENNSAVDGGAIYFTITSTETGATFDNLSFIENKSMRHGAAIYCAGTYNIFLSDSMFRENHATFSAGAIYLSQGARLQSIRSVFYRNLADGATGAIASYSSELVISNTAFIENSSVAGGGALYLSNTTAIFERNTFLSNVAHTGYPASISVSNNSTANISDSIFVGQSSNAQIVNFQSSTYMVNCTGIKGSTGVGFFTSGPGSIAEVRNSILIGPSSIGAVYHQDGSALVENSIIETDLAYAELLFVRAPDPGDGSWSTFEDNDYGDLRLKSASPAIDAGNSDANSNDIDLSGNSRRTDDPDTEDTGIGIFPIIDIGAYEDISDESFSGLYPYLSAPDDFNGDGFSNLYTYSHGGNPLSTEPFIDPSIILYVNVSATGGNNGSSWENAFTNLTQAIIATKAGDKIWIANGTYYPSTEDNRNGQFIISKQITIRGGFTGTETELNQRDLSNPNTRTILSGDIGIRGDKSDNSLRILRISTADGIVLDELTFSNAYRYDASASTNLSGGAIYIERTEDFLFTNVIFEHNEAEGSAGALHISSATGVFENCVFRKNKAQRAGAIFLNNRILDEGSVHFVNTHFLNNEAETRGGAVYLFNGTQDVQFDRCVFYQNKAQSAAAIFSYIDLLEIKRSGFIKNQASTGNIVQTQGPTTILQTAFHGNINQLGTIAVTNKGGPIHIESSIFSGNDTSSVFQFGSETTATLLNCSIVGNTGVPLASLSGVTIQNSLIMKDTGSTDIIFNVAGILDIHSSLIQGEDNFVDPEIVRMPNPGDGDWTTYHDNDYGDLKQTATSMLIDTGDSTFVTAAEDFALNNRIDSITNNVDIGAYEGISFIRFESYYPYLSKYGDINYDGISNFTAYALGLSPFTDSTHNSIPQILADEGRIYLNFNWRNDDGSLGSQFQVSTDLANWTPADIEFSDIVKTPINDFIDHVTVELPAPVENNEFYRIRFVQPL